VSAGFETVSKKKRKPRTGPSKELRLDGGGSIDIALALADYDRGRFDEHDVHEAQPWITRHLNKLGSPESSYLQIRTGATGAAYGGPEDGRIFLGDSGTIFWSSALSHVRAKNVGKPTIHFFDATKGWQVVQKKG